MNRALHVAVAQIHSGGAAEETLERLECQATAAAGVGAELVLFAEGVLHGYDCDMTAASVRAVSETVDGPNCRHIRELAERLGITIVAGFFERHGDDIHNSMLIARPEGSCSTARKFNLTPQEREAKLTPGPREQTVVEINGVRCAVIICADSGISGLHEELLDQRVDYRLCPTGGGGTLSDMLHEADLATVDGRRRYCEDRTHVFKTQAILDERDCPFTGFASANALGPVGKQTCHQGHCMIVDNQRIMRAQIPGTIVLEHMQDQMVHARLLFF